MRDDEVDHAHGIVDVFGTRRAALLHQVGSEEILRCALTEVASVDRNITGLIDRRAVKLDLHKPVDALELRILRPCVKTHGSLLIGVPVTGAQVLIQQRIGSRRTLPAELILNLIALCIEAGGLIPLQSAVERDKAVFLQRPERLHKRDAVTPHVFGLHRCGQLVPVETPRKVEQRADLMAARLHRKRDEDRLKGVARLHRAHVRVLPLVSAEHLGTCLLGPDQRMALHAALDLVHRAGRGVILHRHHRDSIVIVHLGIGAGGDHHAMPLIGPGCALKAVTDILLAVPPAVSVVVDCGNNRIKRCMRRIKRQLHLVGGRIQLARPLIGTVLNLFKRIGRIGAGGNRQQNGLAVGQFKDVAVSLHLKLFHESTSICENCFLRFLFYHTEKALASPKPHFRYQRFQPICEKS